MDKYNKKALKIASVITSFSILFGLIGWWYAHDYIYLNIAAIVIGLNSIIFSHDLTMDRIAKYPSLNYKFSRGMYVFLGLVFVVGSIIRFLQDRNLI